MPPITKTRSKLRIMKSVGHLEYQTRMSRETKYAPIVNIQTRVVRGKESRTRRDQARFPSKRCYWTLIIQAQLKLWVNLGPGTCLSSRPSRKLGNELGREAMLRSQPLSWALSRALRCCCLIRHISWTRGVSWAKSRHVSVIH